MSSVLDVEAAESAPTYTHRERARDLRQKKGHASAWPSFSREVQELRRRRPPQTFAAGSIPGRTPVAPASV